ncbi:MAG: alpha/beta fold hydrolase [Ignavibacteria bacterium]|nr:alpha/beta fold hydrolase [Ignavibacteria bacterium]
MNIPNHIVDEGSGYPVVFIHAFPMNADMWAPQIGALRDGFRVVAYDMPGFARAAPALAPASMEGAADEFIALLDHLGIERCVAAGCSLGGYIAMAVARLHPARLGGLVLADTRSGPDSAEAAANRIKQAAEVRANGIGSVVEAMVPKLLSDASRAAHPSLESRVRGIMERATPEGTACMLEAMAARPSSDATLAALDIPACVLVGEHDALTPPSEAALMAGLLRHAELRVIPDAGHLSNLEAPDVFNAHLRGFLAAIA